MKSGRPNILLILCDQLRSDALGLYGNLHSKTPHIDALGADGVVFDNAFCHAPICMPSRWSIFTGRYPHVHGVRENGVLYDPRERTLADMLKDNKYQTGVFGKMHLTPQLNNNYEDENWPAGSFGFDVKHLTNDHKNGEYLNFLKKKDQRIYDEVLNAGIEKVREDLASASDRTFKLGPQIFENPVPVEFHQSTWIADRFIDYLEKERKNPFFACVSFVDPHHPFDPPEPYASLYDPNEMPLPVKRRDEFTDKPEHFTRMLKGRSPGNEKYDFTRIGDQGWQTIKAKYYGMVSLIDYNIGRIIEKLKRNGEYEKTVIVFTSDHGELLGDHGLLFKGPFHYDGLIRVPLAMKWGDRICGGSRIHEIVQHVDIVPTLLGYAGVPVPRGVQGHSLQTLISGNHGSGYETAVIEHDNMAWGLNMKTLRFRKWRMTYYAGMDFGELYDLGNDPDEFINLWSHEDFRKKREELIRMLLNLLVTTEDCTQPRVQNY